MTAGFSVLFPLFCFLKYFIFNSGTPVLVFLLLNKKKIVKK